MDPIMATRAPSQISVSLNNGGNTGPSNPTPKAAPVNRLPSQQSSAMVHALSVLSPAEQKELAQCEAVIEKGWQTFVDVGLALAKICGQKLYRAEHGTFEAYCREKWQYAKSHAYR